MTKIIITSTTAVKITPHITAENNNNATVKEINNSTENGKFNQHNPGKYPSLTVISKHKRESFISAASLLPA